MIDKSKPPIVGIATEAKKVAEGWMKPILNEGMRHVVNVVGFGEGTDPFDMTKKPYFIALYKSNV